MNADQLLEHFERISDAADAVPRLRRFVLELAMRGRLVPQDPREEPASQLIARIEAEINRLAAEGVIAKKKVPAPTSVHDHPFDLPRGWAVTRLGSIITLLGGQHLQPNEYTEDSRAGLPYITGPADFDGTGLRITRYALKRKAVARIGQLLLTVKGAGVGKTTICTVPEVAISRQLMAVTAVGWDARYLVLITHALAEVLKENARSLIPGIGKEDVELFAMALPPLQEQGRIVAKVDELMALCDRLEAAQTEREARRDRLVSASLARVTETDGADATSTAASPLFQLDHFARLTTRPEHVKQLRQTILNLAVRGRLVPQDPSDAENTMPTSARTLAEETSSRRRRKVPHVDISTLTVAIPPHWKRVTLAELVVRDRGISYGVLVPGPDVSDGIPFVRAQDLSLAANPPAPNKTISATVEKPYARTRLQGDEILLCVVGSIGKLGLVPPSWKGANIARAVARIAPGPHVSREYLLTVLRSTTVQSFFSDATRTLAQPTLNVGLIEQTEIPLPPLAEQRRIVAKVDELMALCDQLEASLASAATERARLLEALLYDALAPAA